jgi:hypothetical protein
MASAEGLGSPSFGLLAQRSEQVRVQIVIGILLVLVTVACIRRVMGGVVMNSPVFWWSVGLLAAGLAYEGWVLLATRRANAAGMLLAEWRWRANAVIETGIAIGLLLISHVFSPRGEVAALSAPHCWCCRCWCCCRCCGCGRRSRCGRGWSARQRMPRSRCGRTS